MPSALARRQLAFLALALGTLLTSTKAKADDAPTVHVASQVAGYTDSVGVSAFTPSARASVESPTSGWEANGLYLVDFVSAASPDIVSTASPRWTEIRHAGGVGARYKPDTFGVGVSGAASYTPDYLALSAGGQIIQDLDEKNLTLVAGYSYGHDTIGRTGTPFSVFSRELTSHAFSAALSRVVNKGLVLGLSADAVFERGDQSKPYRYVPMFAPDVAASIPRGATAIQVADQRLSARPLEALPTERDRWAVSGRMAYRTDHTTVRLDQRLYRDDWNLSATTTDFRWFIDVSERLTVWPHLRVHVQNGVEFWKRAYSSLGSNDLPTFRTGDRELSPLSNFGGGGGLRLALGKGGAKDDVALTITCDGTWTSFSDALYVRNRFSGLGTSSLEVTF